MQHPRLGGTYRRTSVNKARVLQQTNLRLPLLFLAAVVQSNSRSSPQVIAISFISDPIQVRKLARIKAFMMVSHPACYVRTGQTCFVQIYWFYSYTCSEYKSLVLYLGHMSRMRAGFRCCLCSGHLCHMRSRNMRCER